MTSKEQDPDNWDRHWATFGDAAEGNPANVYRRHLILKLLGQPEVGAVLLDIGSGQGEFAIAFKSLHPEVEVWGVEYSALGVMRSRAAAESAAVNLNILQRNLLNPVHLADDQPAATYAVCSETLEHVEDPRRLMRHAISLLAPGARVVVTVPGGPRSAFDRHIGHWRHFDAPSLRRVLTDAGLEVEQVLRAGFPGFNVYKLAVLVRGKKLIRDLESRPNGAEPPRLEAIANAIFGRVFQINLDDFPLGWQLVAVGHVPDASV